MRLIVTGGGTGGHVFPALEIARRAIAEGHDVIYYGSHRGQEKSVCEKEGLMFRPFHSEPFYGVKSIRGWRSGWNLFWAAQKAKRAVKHWEPDVVFSTGGYSSSPVVSAARALEVPYIILEQNSVPGRVNKKAGPDAAAVCTVFHGTAVHFPTSNVIRTGMPIRHELRAAAGRERQAPPGAPLILVMGGSQGAAALNETALTTAKRMGDAVRWLHISGKAHFQEIATEAAKLEGIEYEVAPFLEAEQMAEALASAALAVCRSGAGTLSELATFRIPAVLVPYPAAHGDHQLHNAREFSGIGAATVVEQDQLQNLPKAIETWLEREDMRKRAQVALGDWAIPDATDRIMNLINQAAEA